MAYSETANISRFYRSLGITLNASNAITIIISQKSKEFIFLKAKSIRLIIKITINAIEIIFFMIVYHGF